jgi:putative heme iron utilization protein
MEADDMGLVARLLGERRILALATLVDSEPTVGQLPFAARPDFSALLVHASQLAKHSKGLVEGARFSALVHDREEEGADPFQIPRLTVSGTVRPLTRGSAEYESGRTAYLAKLPTGEIMFSLGDFVLYDLVCEHARLIAGFGRTRNLTAGALRRVAAGEHEARGAGEGEG